MKELYLRQNASDFELIGNKDFTEGEKLLLDAMMSKINYWSTINPNDLFEEEPEEGLTYFDTIVDSDYSYEYTMDSRGNFLGVELIIMFGGPSAQLDTRFDKLIGSWGGSQITINFGGNEQLELLFMRVTAELAEMQGKEYPYYEELQERLEESNFGSL